METGLDYNDKNLIFTPVGGFLKSRTRVNGRDENALRIFGGASCLEPVCIMRFLPKNERRPWGRRLS